MKLLNKKAFKLILIGIIISLIYSVINSITTALDPNLTDFSQLAELGEEFVDLARKIVVGTTIVVAVIIALIYAYFIVRLLKNRKEEAPQGYLKFLFVINVIGIVFNILSLIGGNFYVVMSILINILIIFGCTIQKKSSDSNSNNN